MNEIITNKLAWTIIGTGIISLPIFGEKVIGFLFIFLTILQFFDFLTGFASARKLGKITSKIGINGVIKKSLIFSLSILILISIGGLKGTGIIENNIIGIVPIVFLSIFCFFEIISIFENLSVIFGNSREGKLFNFIAYITNYLFNISLEKLKEKTEQKINEKFNNN